jgi:hypothetical protein
VSAMSIVERAIAHVQALAKDAKGAINRKVQEERERLMGLALAKEELQIALDEAQKYADNAAKKIEEIAARKIKSLQELTKNCEPSGNGCV